MSLVFGVDFDGTIVERSGPLRFRAGARRALFRMHAAGHQLILHSCRCNPAPGASPLLAQRVSGLKLEPRGVLAECIEQVEEELRARGISFVPTFYLGDSDFWTTDRGVSINVPWFLADEEIWALANRSPDLSYTPEEVLQCLRHEVGHAVGYAFELWRRPDWRAAFGSMDLPYRDDFKADPAKDQDFVHYLTDVPAHYGQKHPDEDWAETFGRWLDPAGDWRAENQAGALRKLEFLDELAASDAMVGDPPNQHPGHPSPYWRIRGTVRAVLELPDREDAPRYEEMLEFLKTAGVLGLFEEIWRSPGKPICDRYIDDLGEAPEWVALAQEFGLPSGYGG